MFGYVHTNIIAKDHKRLIGLGISGSPFVKWEFRQQKTERQDS